MEEIITIRKGLNNLYNVTKANEYENVYGFDMVVDNNLLTTKDKISTLKVINFTEDEITQVLNLKKSDSIMIKRGVNLQELNFQDKRKRKEDICYSIIDNLEKFKSMTKKEICDCYSISLSYLYRMERIIGMKINCIYSSGGRPRKNHKDVLYSSITTELNPIMHGNARIFEREFNMGILE